ncbi:hypothetical protein BASA50_004636 [Batrachochytrium salamandrivorans]|uniref:Ran-binding-domain-containing protein n=1 Tax=Batrachochytrium salamandrivorans TaxID=1357716 RepID=A0ABQ8FF90_9FUNG|nr:hypothetical protein BASA61_010583 [Batrachochytrium salamandrivorans]KAH6597285.1 hypothetical protein BASA50_004636 [Batrachochytrium salamandrivorans]KAH9268199.1 hypothetical protein BASA84_000394 [Batrachochytrium salamandrivorans]KAJ1328737.1 hypothetical protein BSLG_009972 [Batrachochytrium salamandrivorans]
MENVLTTLALSGGTVVDRNVLLDSILQTLITNAIPNDALFSSYTPTSSTPPSLYLASLVGKAALSYAQGVAVKRIAHFLQTKVDPARHGLVLSTSKHQTPNSKQLQLHRQHYEDDDSDSEYASAASPKTPFSPYPDAEAEAQAETRFKTLRMLQLRLEHKLALLTPAIDLCEWAAARGHSVLESVLTLSNDLNTSLDELSVHISTLHPNKPDLTLLDGAIQSFEEVLSQLDNLVPFVQMGLQISGVQFGNRVPVGVSPVLLMRASTALSLMDCESRPLQSSSLCHDKASSDTRHSADHKADSLAGTATTLTEQPVATGGTKSNPALSAPVPSDPLAGSTSAVTGESAIKLILGPLIIVKVYTLFESSSRSRSVVDWTWKEEYAKCHVRLCRYPNEYQYQLHLDQDLNDGRYHDPSEKPASSSKLPVDGVDPVPLTDSSESGASFIAGACKHIPLAHIQRVFYTNSGKLLNIEDANSPVLVLKIVQPRNGSGDGGKAQETAERPLTPQRISTGTNSDRLAPQVQWIALELFDSSSSSSSDTVNEKDHDVGSESDSCYYDPSDTDSRDGSGASDVESLAGHVNSLDLDPHATPPSGKGIDVADTLCDSDSKRITLVNDRVHPAETQRNTDVSPPADSRSRPTGASSKVDPERVSDAPCRQHILGELCFLDYLLRLASLEQTQSMSHLKVSDEKLYFFLMNEATGSNAGSAAAVYHGGQAQESRQQQYRGELTHAGGAGIAAMARAGGDVPIHATVRKQPRSAPHRRDLGHYERDAPSSPLARKTGGPSTRFVDKLRQL